MFCGFCSLCLLRADPRISWQGSKSSAAPSALFPCMFLASLLDSALENIIFFFPFPLNMSLLLCARVSHGGEAQPGKTKTPPVTNSLSLSLLQKSQKFLASSRQVHKTAAHGLYLSEFPILSQDPSIITGKGGTQRNNQIFERQNFQMFGGSLGALCPQGKKQPRVKMWILAGLRTRLSKFFGHKCEMLKDL